MAASALNTVVSIPVIAFAEDGSVDVAGSQAAIDRMASAGITAFTATGNTGEFYSLSAEERRTAHRLTAEAAPGAQLIAGVGLDVATAIAEGQHALDAGFQSVMVHHPPHPFVSPEGWLEYNLAIARALPDANIVPYVKSPLIPRETIRRLIDRAENVGAVKFAVADPTEFGQVVTETVRPVQWVCGVAEMWAPTFWGVTGVAAFTSGLANVAPKLSLELFAALQAGDLAKATELWQLVAPFERLRFDHASKNNVSVVKSALGRLGVCSSAVRAPISQLGQAEERIVAEVLDALRDAGLLD
jgi:4-hydroxy-tetrahydrodipicolinate synthase